MREKEKKKREERKSESKIEKKEKREERKYIILIFHPTIVWFYIPILTITRMYYIPYLDEGYFYEFGGQNSNLRELHPPILML